MSDTSQGPGWWMASDGKWYPPETYPSYQQAIAPAPKQRRMGWLERHREQKAEKKAAAEAHEEALREEAALHTWEEEDTALRSLIDIATNYNGYPDAPIDLKQGEARFFILDNAHLVEVRRSPGHRVGGYAGPSVRIAKGVYWHMGGTASTYVPGEDVMKVIDSGTAVVTSQRVAFLGEKQSREFSFAKLIAYEHDPATCTTSFHVSNRQKVSEIGYGNVSHWCFYVDLAHAHFTNSVPGFVADLNRQLVEHQAQKPQSESPAAGSTT